MKKYIILTITGILIISGILLFNFTSLKSILPKTKKDYVLVVDQDTKSLLRKDSIFADSGTPIDQFDNIMYFQNGNLIAKKGDKTLYEKFESDGSISINEELNTINPSSANISVFEEKNKIYIFNSLLENGLRVITIDSSKNMSDNLLPHKSYKDLYDDNEPFDLNGKIYFPNGYNSITNKPTLLVFNTDDFSLNDIDVNTDSCGSGNFELTANTKAMLLLKDYADNKVCLYNFASQSKIFTTDVVNSFYKIIPENNLLIRENYSLKNKIPTSNGKISLFNYKDNSTQTFDLSSNQLFQDALNQSGGGFSLISKYLIDKNLSLFSRGSDKNLEMEINSQNMNLINLSETANQQYAGNFSVQEYQ